MERSEALLALVEWRGELSQLITALQQFPWDSERALVVLTPAHIRRVLEKYLNSQASEAELEKWAEAVEGREDLEYLDGFEETISEILFKLSTPAINHSLDRQTAARWLGELSSL